jgi:hypothetical protein
MSVGFIPPAGWLQDWPFVAPDGCRDGSLTAALLMMLTIPQ